MIPPIGPADAMLDFAYLKRRNDSVVSAGVVDAIRLGEDVVTRSRPVVRLIEQLQEKAELHRKAEPAIAAYMELTAANLENRPLTRERRPPPAAADRLQRAPKISPTPARRLDAGKKNLQWWQKD